MEKKHPIEKHSAAFIYAFDHGSVTEGKERFRKKNKWNCESGVPQSKN